MKISENESIFLQALATTSLLAELSNQGFLNSEYYKSLCFTGNNDNFKNILKSSGLGNPATMQMFLYILLVMPKEILKDIDTNYMNKIENEFNQICVGVVEPETNSTYSNENSISSINYYRHIRNAVSHAKCFYKKDNEICYVTFKDKDHYNNHCEIIMKTSNVGFILEKLQIQIMEYFNNKHF